IFIPLLLLVLCSARPESPTIPADKGKTEGGLVWYDVRLLGLEGQGFRDLKAPFDRLPSKAEKVVPRSVWGLSRHSAGLAVRFKSDATTLSARWTLTSKNLAMNHMPATGVSGVDLYVRDAKGAWMWLGNGRPAAQTNTSVLARGLPAGSREFLLYLPLYNGVSSVEIGLPKGSKLEKAPARPAHRSKPIVF